MDVKRLHTLQLFTLAAFSGLICLLIVSHISGISAKVPESPYNIHIAFGFQGNLYHSFRNDTNDEAGFGKDIRVIRHVIATLNRLNGQGVPVKGVWDFDNLFRYRKSFRNMPRISSPISAGASMATVMKPY